MALVHARRRRPAVARRVAQEAVEFAARSDWLNLHAETLEDLAAVEAGAERVGEAANALDRAVELYAEKGNLVAHERALTRRQLLPA